MNLMSITTLARADVQGIQYLVTRQRFEQGFTDGTMTWLHLVRQPHEHKASIFVRALHTDGAWLLFDLRHLASKLDGELPLLPEQAAHGVVFYTLRRMCSTAAELIQLVRANTLARAVPLPPAVDELQAGDAANADELREAAMLRSATDVAMQRLMYGRR